MTDFENKPFKRHALAYDAIEKLLRTAESPRTASELHKDTVIAELGTKITTLYDILESFHHRKLVRKVPAHSGRGKWAYEWITVGSEPVVIVKRPPVTVPDPFIPEIIVSATSVIIKTSKIKITVEY